MNKKELTHCIFCQSTRLYFVSETQCKCATCKKKFSHKKYFQEIVVLEYFLKNISAKSCSEHLMLNYNTIQKIYTKARRLITSYSEATYLAKEKNFSEYDEYYFLSQTKKGKSKFLFEAIGVLGMMYGDVVYTLLLPDQFLHLKYAKEESETFEADSKEYARYLNYHKVAYHEEFDNKLGKFWNFFETFMLHFKGVSKKQFIYYLKEAEFKFNHPKKEQKEILMELWSQYM